MVKLTGISFTGKLEIPNTSKVAFKLFPDKKGSVEARLCPICGNKVNVGPGPTEFRDKLSVKEYLISGLCQKCQDESFDID